MVASARMYLACSARSRGRPYGESSIMLATPHLKPDYRCRWTIGSIEPLRQQPVITCDLSSATVYDTPSHRSIDIGAIPRVCGNIPTVRPHPIPSPDRSTELQLRRGHVGLDYSVQGPTRLQHSKGVFGERGGTSILMCSTLPVRPV